MLCWYGNVSHGCIIDTMGGGNLDMGKYSHNCWAKMPLQLFMQCNEWSSNFIWQKKDVNVKIKLLQRILFLWEIITWKKQLLEHASYFIQMLLVDPVYDWYLIHCSNFSTHEIITKQFAIFTITIKDFMIHVNDLKQLKLLENIFLNAQCTMQQVF